MRTYRFISSSFLFFISFFSFSQNDTILIEQLEVHSIESLTLIPANNVIVGSDYIFLQNYDPEITLFYYQGELFTGVAKYDDSSHLTLITFLEGKIHGRWYDETIWNNHLTFEGEYVNGLKNGIWQESSDGNYFRKENYLNDILHGKQITYIDYFSTKDRTYELDGVKINTAARIERNYLNGVLTDETYLLSDETALNGVLIQKNTENIDSTIEENRVFFKDGKFIGSINFCYNDPTIISLEYHLLESGLVEKKEYDCNTGMLIDEGLFKPNKLFTSNLYFMNEEDFERQ
jgi:hypothetical protein